LIFHLAILSLNEGINAHGVLGIQIEKSAIKLSYLAQITRTSDANVDSVLYQAFLALMNFGFKTTSFYSKTATIKIAIFSNSVSAGTSTMRRKIVKSSIEPLMV
jgi:hypothetical protein